MTEIGSIKKMDDAGRIVIPAEMRKAIGMDYGDFVYISMMNGKIELQGYDRNRLKCMLLQLIKCYCKVYRTSLVVTDEDNAVITCFGSSALHKETLTEALLKRLQESYMGSMGTPPLYYSTKKVWNVEAVHPIYTPDGRIGSLILVETNELYRKMEEKMKGLELIAEIVVSYIQEGRKL